MTPRKSTLIFSLASVLGSSGVCSARCSLQGSRELPVATGSNAEGAVAGGAVVDKVVVGRAAVAVDGVALLVQAAASTVNIKRSGHHK